jgi:hypothetical protein
MLLYNKYREYIHLFIAIYGTIAYYFLEIEHKIKAAHATTLFIMFDIVLNNELSKDIVFHHILSIFSGLTLFFYDITDVFDIVATPLLGFQVSSIFLSINYIYKNNINQILFIITFLYYRIYIHYMYTINNIEFKLFTNKFPIFIPIHYLFFSLNIYWTCFIVKKIIKSLKIQYSNTEWVLQYLLFLNIPITFYKYIRTNDNYILIDVVGHIILSFGNYKYHSDLLLNYTHNKPLVMKSFLYDHVAIRAHAALTLTTYCIINNNYNVLYVILINHICSSIYALYITQNKKMIEFNKPSQLKITLINWLQVNILMDSLILSNMYNNVFNMYIILLLSGCIYKYQIFYEYSHFMFHVLLICQNCLIYTF